MPVAARMPAGGGGGRGGGRGVGDPERPMHGTCAAAGDAGRGGHGDGEKIDDTHRPACRHTVTHCPSPHGTPHAACCSVNVHGCLLLQRTPLKTGEESMKLWN